MGTGDEWYRASYDNRCHTGTVDEWEHVSYDNRCHTGTSDTREQVTHGNRCHTRKGNAQGDTPESRLNSLRNDHFQNQSLLSLKTGSLFDSSCRRIDIRSLSTLLIVIQIGNYGRTAKILSATWMKRSQIDQIKMFLCYFVNKKVDSNVILYLQNIYLKASFILSISRKNISLYCK